MKGKKKQITCINSRATGQERRNQYKRIDYRKPPHLRFKEKR